MKLFSPLIYLCSLLLLVSSCSDDSSPAGISTPTPVPAPISQTKYIYETDNNYALAAIGTRAATTTVCSTTYAAHNGSWALSCSHYVAVLGYTGDHGVIDLPANYGVPLTGPVTSVSGAQTFGTSWADFLDTSVAHAGPTGGHSDAGFSTGSSVWTGLANDGSAGGNCQDFTSTQNAQSANLTFLYFGGGGGGLSFQWIGSILACNNAATLPFLCMCW
jgi:hypothetical protein